MHVTQAQTMSTSNAGGGTRDSAVAAIRDAGVDQFFALKVMALRQRGHVADRVSFDELGNGMSSISFVAVAGEARRLASMIEICRGNVFSMQVRALASGQVRVMFLAPDGSSILDPEFLEPAELTREALVQMFAEFVDQAASLAGKEW